jgi:hypothetical protein
MSARTVHPTAPAQPAAAPHRNRRAAVAAVAATALIAAGGYVTARTVGSSPTPEHARTGEPSPQLTRERNEMIAHLYGPHAVAVPRPSSESREDITRQNHETTIAHYGPRR